MSHWWHLEGRPAKIGPVHLPCVSYRERSVTFSMFTLGNATFACSIRSARERSFEEACGETEVGSWLAPEPRPLPPLALRTRPRHANRTPTWSSDLCGRYFARNWTIPVVVLATVVATTATLSSNSRKSSSCFFTHFTSVLRKQFAGNDTFLREANSYKRALALRNSRLGSTPTVARMSHWWRLEGRPAKLVPCTWRPALHTWTLGMSEPS